MTLTEIYCRLARLALCFRRESRIGGTWILAMAAIDFRN